MGNAKRWSVTYTKHMKQKRKVYQDGFLELQDSSNKVMLYDECEKLLECRLLKNDEIVTPGGTLLFNAYLIDIGDPEGDNNNPVSDFNVDTTHDNIVGRPNRLNGSNVRIQSDDRKFNVKKNKAQQALSPSQKFIKEFKKRELLKYGSPKITPETTKPSTTEWQVLYTTQVTQKAKKYHDGFLRLVICGSRQRQVILFDANRKLLDRRFLKEDDVIRPGELLVFDAYLVDIGEDQGNCEPDSSVQGNNCTDARRIKKMHRQQCCLDTHVTVGKSEWQVVYTTQITKKAKKYHDGFLQLEICGSQGRQVVLCDLSKRPIERRFLKKDEVIRPGESVYFDGHLVDVGEPEGSLQSLMNSDEQSAGDNIVERRQIRPGQNGCLKANQFVVKGKPYSKACLSKDADLNSFFSGSDVIKSNKIVPPTRPLRDTHQILSILQNPVAQESNVTGGQLTIDSARNHGSCENLQDKESIETIKSANMMSSKGSAAASGGVSFQVTENIEMSHQPYSHKEAQTKRSEADWGFAMSSSGAHSSCLVTSEGESAEEFASKREMNDCPSFALGF